MNAPLPLSGRFRLIETLPGRPGRFLERREILLATLVVVLHAMEQVILFLLARHPSSIPVGSLLRAFGTVGGAIMRAWGVEILLGLTATALIVALLLLLAGGLRPTGEVTR